MPHRSFKSASLLTSLLLLAAATSAAAGIRPSYSFEECAWPATDIVVAAQGPKSGDPVTLLEVWKGDLKPGAVIQVVDLPAAPIPLSTEFGIKRSLKSVTGERIILFLKRADESAQPLAPAAPLVFTGTNIRGGAQVSAVWIEQGQAYAFQQMINPGPTELHPLDQTEADLKKQTLALLAARDELHKSQAIANTLDRANALAPMTGSPYWYERREAFAALGNCGKDALPLLRPMLQTNRNNCPELVQAIAAAAGPDAAAELTAILQTELPYWRKTAPTLKTGWWNADPAENRALLIARYDILIYSLRALAALPHSPQPPIVAQLREFWASLPQLNDKSGLNEIIEECDLILPHPQGSAPQ